ncbi:MAG: GNAT family N-acetyltransferase [Allomuricauda sp.]
MKLKTERLTLIPFDKNDLEIFHNTNIDPFVKKYLWDDEEIPISVSESILQEVGIKFKKEQWGLWKITDSDENYLGYIGFWFFFDEQLPQLLYALLPKSTGNGYATEASKVLIDYAFSTLGFAYIKAAMDKPNIDSVKVCERLQMHFIEEKEIEGKVTLFYQLKNKD